VRVDYDRVAPTYDRRYAANPLTGIALALQALVRRINARNLLEVGCGTGHWLETLQDDAGTICGLDFSPGMLAQARLRNGRFHLVRGRAWELPFAAQTFDLVFCVNAIHHFEQQEGFIQRASWLLRPGGALALIGMDPHSGRDRYYLYDYFEGTLETDKRRFPPGETIAAWMLSNGFDRLEQSEAERIYEPFSGEAVLQDLFLKKNATSQLTLLSDEGYAAGIERIQAALEHARADGREIAFPVDISLRMVVGYM
jgi:SAM-dependent methyltransferase